MVRPLFYDIRTSADLHCQLPCQIMDINSQIRYENYYNGANAGFIELTFNQKEVIFSLCLFLLFA